MELNDEKVMRLAKPVRKGLLHMIFSRIFIIVVLIALQILVWLNFLMMLEQTTQMIYYVQMILAIVLTIYLFNCSMDSSAKLTWVLLITVAPISGSIFLWYTQSNAGHGKETVRVMKEIESTKGKLPQDEEILKEIEDDGSGVDDLCKYLNRSGCFPIYNNTEATYFPLGEEKFEAMLTELEKAEDFIFLEYFIVEEGYMWGRILDILARKAAEGVEVRMLYDGMCEISNVPHGYWKLLEEQGIHAKPYSTLKPILSSSYNYRDHRKILSIDGKVAFTGGVNLADEYINKIERFGHWKDTAVMVKGPAAVSFTLIFLQMWNVGSDEPDYDEWLSKCKPEPQKANGYVMPYADFPLDKEKVAEAVYMDILYRAKDYVYIMTPYLILDDGLKSALKFAAERGVDVRIILPGIPDKFVPYALAKTHYRELVASGVKIYEYTPGFVHAKVFVSDDMRAVVGTINLDYRSLYHHFECAAYMYETDCIPEILADYKETEAKCRTVTPETIKNEKWYYRATGQIAKLISPLM